MEHFVGLERLPEGVDFPADLRDRIRFDADAQRLVHQGFMSKADFDRLCKLSDDWSYRRPLEELFRLCVEGEQKPSLVRRLAASVHEFWGLA